MTTTRYMEEQLVKDTTYYVLQKLHGDREGGYVILEEDGRFNATFTPERATRFTNSVSALQAVARRAALYATKFPWAKARATDSFRLVEIIYIVPAPTPGNWKIGRAL